MISTDLQGLIHTCWQRDPTKHSVGIIDGLGPLGYVHYVVVHPPHVGRITGSPGLTILELVFPTFYHVSMCIYVYRCK